MDISRMNGFDSGEVSHEDMMKTILDNMDKIGEIMDNTKTLQNNIELANGDRFHSATYYPEDKPPMYSGMYTEIINIVDVVDEALKNAGDVELSPEDKMKYELMKMLGNDANTEIIFAITVTNESVDVRMGRDGSITQTIKFNNVKTANDVIKLASFFEEKYVEPLLKDFDDLKEILGS